MSFIEEQKNSKVFRKFFTPIIILSGEPGVGKSTVAKSLCKKLNKSIFISIDVIRHLVVAGYVDPATKSWTQFEEQFNLSNDAVLAIAKLYAKKGFIPVIEGVVLSQQHKLFQKKLRNFRLHTFLLEESKHTLRMRKLNRRKKVPNTESVKKMIRDLEQFKLEMKKNKNFYIIKKIKQSN